VSKQRVYLNEAIKRRIYIIWERLHGSMLGCLWADAICADTVVLDTICTWIICNLLAVSSYSYRNLRHTVNSKGNYITYHIPFSRAEGRHTVILPRRLGFLIQILQHSLGSRGTTSPTQLLSWRFMEIFWPQNGPRYRLCHLRGQKSLGALEKSPFCDRTGPFRILEMAPFSDFQGLIS
jgi:hypothetical protein